MKAEYDFSKGRREDNSSNEQLVTLVTDLIEKLDQKMDRRFDEMNARFDTQAARLSATLGER